MKDTFKWNNLGQRLIKMTTVTKEYNMTLYGSPKIKLMLISDITIQGDGLLEAKPLKQTKSWLEIIILMIPKSKG